MANRTIVTFGSDGFRDWVSFPDGRTFNLGSVSVLKFVVELARNQTEARRSLNTFLANQSATLAVRMDELEHLIAPKRARWAGIENTLIPLGSQTDLTQGVAMAEDVNTLQSSHEHGEGCRCKAAAYDADMAKELEVYLDNEMSLQGQRRNIMKKLLKSGSFDVKDATREFEHWVETGAKSYAREFNEDPKKFSRDLVKDLAEKMAKSTKKAVDSGEWDHLKSASEDDQEEQTKQADDHTALINEGIAHAIMAKVEKAFEIVAASREDVTPIAKYASVAKNDLHRISSELSALLEASDLADPAAMPALLDLSKKADHVLNYFAR